MEREQRHRQYTGSFWDSLRFAVRGIGRVFIAERNMKIHAAATAAVTLLALWLDVPARDWPPLLICFGVVMGLEAMNSAVERAVDLASPERRALAAWAKDAAAGAVLIAAVFAVIIAVILLGPPLWERFA